jgi:DNA-directed RNA polymerase subunit RPC12/RpoP
MQKFKPPRCPNCGALLEYVYENVYETWYFDEESGTYKENPTACDMEIRCPNCNITLYDVFPEGVCNYKAKP